MYFPVIETQYFILTIHSYSTQSNEFKIRFTRYTDKQMYLYQEMKYNGHILQKCDIAEIVHTCI